MSNQGFGNVHFNVASNDGRNVINLRRERYTNCYGIDFYLPEAAASDGASIPQVCWSLGFTPFGPWWRPALFHDAAYKNLLEYENGTKCNLDRAQCDYLLMDMMLACGVDNFHRHAIYENVRLFGGSAFHKDRNHELQTWQASEETGLTQLTAGFVPEAEAAFS
jgi:hypothetical protein